jgi:hypothetical protein
MLRLVDGERDREVIPMAALAPGLTSEPGPPAAFVKLAAGARGCDGGGVSRERAVACGEVADADGPAVEGALKGNAGNALVCDAGERRNNGNPLELAPAYEVEAEGPACESCPKTAPELGDAMRPIAEAPSVWRMGCEMEAACGR